MDDIDLLENVDSAEHVRRTIASIFNLGKDLRSRILIDLFFNAYLFARQHKFTREQTSAFVSILKHVHEVSTETPFGNVEEAYAFMKSMILCHSVKMDTHAAGSFQRPPFSVEIFGVQGVHLITEYIVNTYLRHYKLYKYAFTPLVRLDLSIGYTDDPDPDPKDFETYTQAEEGPDESTGIHQVQENREISNAFAVEVPPEEIGDTAEENESARQLGKLIESRLATEVEKLRLDVDKKLQETDKIINQRLGTAGGSAKKKKK